MSNKYSAFMINHPWLMELFEPVHEIIFGHHITVSYPDTMPAPYAKEVTVVGIASDDKGQCLIVSVDGTIHRPNGGIYHITLSCKKGVKPVYSNMLIEKGWEWLKFPQDINVIPALLGS